MGPKGLWQTGFGASLALPALGTTWGHRGLAGAQGRQGWGGVGSLVMPQDVGAAPALLQELQEKMLLSLIP